MSLTSSRWFFFHLSKFGHTCWCMTVEHSFLIFPLTNQNLPQLTWWVVVLPEKYMFKKNQEKKMPTREDWTRTKNISSPRTCQGRCRGRRRPVPGRRVVRDRQSLECLFSVLSLMNYHCWYYIIVRRKIYFCQTIDAQLAKWEKCVSFSITTVRSLGNYYQYVTSSMTTN